MAADRPHDVNALTAAELERARRDLEVSLALAVPGSPVRVPILAELGAIDRELARRATIRPAAQPPPHPLRPGQQARPARKAKDYPDDPHTASR